MIPFLILLAVVAFFPALAGLDWLADAGIELCRLLWQRSRR